MNFGITPRSMELIIDTLKRKQASYLGFAC